MSFASFIFPITTVVLAVACFACYRNSKPLREKAKEEAKEAAEKKVREVAYAREQERQQVFKREVVELLENLLQNPERYTSTTDYTRRHEKFPAVRSLVDQFRHWEQIQRTNKRLEESLSAQGKTIRELRAEIKEVHNKLQPYA